MNGSPKSDVMNFPEALQLPSAQRATYPGRAYGSDTDLRQKVEALLQANDQVGDFLEESCHHRSRNFETSIIIPVACYFGCNQP